ncbi:hypothetical protein ACUXNS_002928 [Brevibacterium pityocampae]
MMLLLLLTACGSSGEIPSTPDTSTVAAQSTPADPETTTGPRLREDWLKLECNDEGHESSHSASSIKRAWDLAPADRVHCDATFVGFASFTTTETEREAVEVAEYDELDDIRHLYGKCAEAYLGDYGESHPWSEAQIKEADGALILCPDHPEREEVEERIAKAGEVQKARERGEIFNDGTYRVGDDIPAGTYVTESDTGFENCYWERLDATGEIIDNNFVRNGFRAEVAISASDYSFSTDGCGEWRKQG